MSINSLDVHPRILQTLRKARIIKVVDLLSLTKAQLERKLCLTSNEVAGLLQAASVSAFTGTQVRLIDVYRGKCEDKNQHFKCTVGCPVIDHALSGGILLPGITEIFGESSAGKTQFCMQLCLSCQLPRKNNGLASGVLYISTEDAFPVKRLKQMTELFYNAHKSDLAKEPMDNVFIEHAGDLDDLWQLLRRKIKLLLSKGLIRLIIVDSIAALFRVEFDMDEMTKRSHALVMFGKELIRISRENSVAVVCVNQVSDVIEKEQRTDLKGKRTVKPTLGLTWSYMVTTRISLSRTSWTVSSLIDTEASQEGPQSKQKGSNAPSPVVRLLKVMFAPHLSNNEVYYYIDEGGIHGIDI